jgi:Fe-S oxidoreductase
MSMSDDQKMLERLGLDFELVDAGCCGMAGAFCFEKQHYEVSIKAGERVPTGSCT